MTDEIQFSARPAGTGDLEAIVERNIRLAIETEAKRLDRSTVRRGVEQALARPELARYFIAEIGGRAVGQLMITYEWSDWRCGVLWWIQSVYIDATFRRQGVFRRLFQHVERLARADDEVCGLRLYVESHNAPALATYRGLGMSPTGHLVYEVDWSGAVKNDMHK